MHTKLIKSLQRIVAVTDKPVGQNFLKSGNILNKLKALEIEDALELADAFYDRTSKEKETSERGYLLGRLNKTKKPVYRFEIAPYVLFFIGTEADILRKIANFSSGKEDTGTKGTKDKTKDEAKVKEILEEDIV